MVWRFDRPRGRPVVPVPGILPRCWTGLPSHNTCIERFYVFHVTRYGRTVSQRNVPRRTGRDTQEYPVGIFDLPRSLSTRSFSISTLRLCLETQTETSGSRFGDVSDDASGPCKTWVTKSTPDPSYDSFSRGFLTLIRETTYVNLYIYLLILGNLYIFLSGRTSSLRVDVFCSFTGLT